MTTAILFKYLAAIAAGYLIGSIPFGFLVGRRFAKVDVRNFGSGKMGTTNVLRVAGKKAAALVFILDMSKGVLAVLAAWLLLRGEYQADVGTPVWYMIRTATAVAALAAIAGHVWPIFLKFKGGRGVATFYGGMFALCPTVAFFSGQVFLLGASTTRFVSLASIAGAVASYVILVPLVLFSGFPWENLLYGAVGAFAIIVMHRDNIVRLVNGKERRLGDKEEVAVSSSGLPGGRVPRLTPVIRRIRPSYLKWSRQNLHE
jgi:glycerol-3-phosphate acyltransferase PlsY